MEISQDQLKNIIYYALCAGAYVGLNNSHLAYNNKARDYLQEKAFETPYISLTIEGISKLSLSLQNL